uniref:Uncharacterized protein n=1 Tax=CrAss-like virus sp. ctRQZ5 TaxID=2826824 RepID=A0A8S5LY55_9CAUD|nr:MAG TPA: hypothetical protein [CrAss-like virus sp. ctRQZ5]DAM18814.1 MAG TPA: hypothetical protein [Caudoviricetes sp.]DAR70457.1 MAG TPA: hypothetical protein [Caudoviricetes sp.]
MINIIEYIDYCLGNSITRVSVTLIIGLLLTI